ncbi:MAG: hypothetical protein ACRDUA_00570 [Micromonosporaceae bacterium]
MPTGEAQPWKLLHSLDGPAHLEFPANHERRRAGTRFNHLAERLARAFHDCLVDKGQDASFHGRLVVPSVATVTGRQLVISISNFGDLAVVSVDNPGVWNDEEAIQLLHSDDATRIRGIFDDLGYTVVPEEPLWHRYDGACDALVASGATWWIRYFDYL